MLTANEWKAVELVSRAVALEVDRLAGLATDAVELAGAGG